MSESLDAIDQLFTSGLNKVILVTLTLSSVFVVLEVVGLLPDWLSKRINRNRLRETMRLLKEFGIDAETSRRVNRVAHLGQISGGNLKERVESRLKRSKISAPVIIGTQVPVEGDHYVDLMGATCDMNVAMSYARDLSALWRSLADVGGAVKNIDIDFIVTPKTGSPLLGSCFAELLNKPFLLHNPKRKFESNPENSKAWFDFNELPAPGSRGLMVDDSSTGGGKAASLIDDLRHFGWEVSDFLVVFEPQLKATTGQNAAERLKPKSVTLHSIVKT